MMTLWLWKLALLSRVAQAHLLQLYVFLCSLTHIQLRQARAAAFHCHTHTGPATPFCPPLLTSLTAAAGSRSCR